MIGRGESLPVAPSIALPRSLRVSRFTLVRVLWRSFFFQAATNYERMQNVGFAYSMIPALTELYRGEDLKRAMARHLLFFNSHPYMADALLGATVRLEEDVAAGKLPPERVTAFKAAMMGPMAAIGDSFFYASLKPFAAALAVAGIVSDVLWAPIVFLVLYNMFHLGLRCYGLAAGYNMGERVFEKLYQIDLVQFSDRSHYMAAICIGVSGALVVDHAAHLPGAFGSGLELILLLALTLICFQCLKRRITMPWLLYGFSALSVALIGVLNMFFPLIE